MSDVNAIMGVSATLQALLRDRVQAPPAVADVPVTISTPLPEVQGAEPAAEDTRLNLFLYRVTENAFLKNQEIPGHGQNGAYGNPPLSLDLHYLLTAYGATVDGAFLNETRAQFVLGSAMRVLHDHPIITEAAVTVRQPAGLQILHPSLRGEFERVKLTLDPIAL